MPQMRLKEFRALVAQASGMEYDNDFVGAAVLAEAEERGELRQERAQAVANSAQERAGNWVRASRGSEDASETLRAELGLNPEAALVSKAFAKRLEPWARELRKEGGFGSSAPFPDEGTAADWIERRSAADRERWAKGRSSKVDAGKKIRQLAEFAGLDVTPRARLLKYGRPGEDDVKNAPVFPGTFLDRLARETDRVSERTAFQPETLTGYVLTGFQPLISRVRITESKKICFVHGDRIQSRWVTLRFHAADVAYDEVRSLYAEIRKFFGATNAERLTWPEADFLSLVDSLNGPPEYGKTRFWKEVLRRWKEEPAAHYSELNSWRAARNKYERLDARTNIRELTTPNPPPPPMSEAEIEEWRRLPPNIPRPPR